MKFVPFSYSVIPFRDGRDDILDTNTVTQNTVTIVTIDTVIPALLV
ncbi:MAG: hypothetical protein IJQ50_07735 [Clostridia bacterium]|nr:hypothetical protein [Clostridia bacterium]